MVIRCTKREIIDLTRSLAGEEYRDIAQTSGADGDYEVAGSAAMSQAPDTDTP